MKPKKNKHFNRVEYSNHHEYQRLFEERQKGVTERSGFIKCKLLHAEGLSLVVPDQIFFEKYKLFWIQPLFFDPTILIADDDGTICTIYVDISFGRILRIRFNTNDFIRRFDDKSELFKCQILGPPDIQEYSTGEAYWDENGIPFLRFFHHTKKDAVEGIKSSGQYWLSKWNIRGNKELTNVGFVYFTSLDKIKFNEDLVEIAMISKGGKFALTLDQSPYGKPDTIMFDIYRGNTADRRYTLANWINASYLAPQPIHQHGLPGQGIYYAVVEPYIYRVGVEPDQVLEHHDNVIGDTDSPVKRFEYLILGDASTIAGLEAPFDEEKTDQIFKIADVGMSQNILEYWFENSNQDLYSDLSPELIKFK
jgi:hypothetical protein